MPESDSSVRNIQWSAQTDVGKFRKNNEDAFIALAVDNKEIQRLGKIGDATTELFDFVFAVSDGMGGAKAGEFASQIAVDHIAHVLPKSFRSAALGWNTGFKDVLELLFDGIHADVTKMGRSYDECSGMGATLSLGWLGPEWLYFAHVGDSRIYHFPKASEMRQVTHDHTRAGYLERTGKINEREARNHPTRNSLQQVLGGRTQFLEPHIGAVKHEPGDVFLFCSDGLTDGIWNRRLEELVRTHAAGDIDALAKKLVDFSVQASGRDNTTAIVVAIQ